MLSHYVKTWIGDDQVCQVCKDLIRVKNQVSRVCEGLVPVKNLVYLTSEYLDRVRIKDGQECLFMWPCGPLE